MNCSHAGHRQGMIHPSCMEQNYLSDCLLTCTVLPSATKSKIMHNLLKDNIYFLILNMYFWNIPFVHEDGSFLLCLSGVHYFLLILMLLFLKQLILFRQKCLLQEFHVCHIHYVISGGNRKENPQQNCFRNQFLFLALLFHVLCVIVAGELNAECNEKETAQSQTPILWDLILGLKLQLEFFLGNLQVRLFEKSRWSNFFFFFFFP